MRRFLPEMAVLGLCLAAFGLLYADKRRAQTAYLQEHDRLAEEVREFHHSRRPRPRLVRFGGR